MTFLLEWGFSIVAELCPQIPSLLSQKKMMSALNSLGPLGWLVEVSARLRPGGQKTSPPHLPSCAHIHRGLCSGWQNLAEFGCDACPHASLRIVPADLLQLTALGSLAKKFQLCLREGWKGPWQPLKEVKLCIPLTSGQLYW